MTEYNYQSPNVDSVIDDKNHVGIRMNTNHDKEISTWACTLAYTIFPSHFEDIFLKRQAAKILTKDLLKAESTRPRKNFLIKNKMDWYDKRL